jgi:hypothetical protein
MADEQMNDTWDASVVQANGINLQRIVDDYANLAAQQAQAAQKHTDALWAQQLRFTEQWQQVAQQAAINLTQHSQRTAANAASWDNLVIAGEVDTTAQGSMANTLADRMRSVAFEAVQSAMSMTAQTAPPAQGTTGVAQGAMQMGGGVATAAILAQIAKLAEAVNVLYIKVLGEEGTAEKPV